VQVLVKRKEKEIFGKSFYTENLNPKSVNDVNVVGLIVVLILFAVILVLLLNPNVPPPNLGSLLGLP